MTMPGLEFMAGEIWSEHHPMQPEAEGLRLLPAELAREQLVLPLALRPEGLYIATPHTHDLDMLADLRVLTGYPLIAFQAARDALDKALDRHYRQGGGQTSKSKTPVLEGPDHPIIRLVHEIIHDAVRLGSSDIHLEPFERDMQVRLRQDGVLRAHRTLHARNKNEVVSRIKVMAHLDIAERRRPQDGRIRIETASGQVDLRVSTLPTDFGEKVVLRILDKGSVPLELASLGMNEGARAHLEKALAAPYGLLIMTGPTGAGKTTTLYACLNRIKSPDINIVTVEDPIEYKLDGIIQTAVKSEINYTFANALRTILRQDPNVILVGEIRDRETAEIAIRAALTGHLVLSTLHANDAPSAVTRLMDMGIEPFLLSSAVTLIGAQRLVRKICPHCSEAADPQGLSPQERAPDAAYKRGRGCSFCGRTGYSGRVGVYEILPVTDALRSLINDKKDAARLREQAEAEGMQGLRVDGMAKAALGLTTVDEVLRETV